MTQKAGNEEEAGGTQEPPPSGASTACCCAATCKSELIGRRNVVRITMGLLPSGSASIEVPVQPHLDSSATGKGEG